MPPNALSPETVDLLIAAWLFVIGAAVGSFLNVVVYRVPLGKSLVSPPSHCPNCNHPIRWFDNLPIFGWIILGGRCRDCREKISARYPTVEMLTATLFLVLGTFECVLDCSNLPNADALGLWHPFGLYAYHILLLCTLLSAAIIEYDGNRVPPRLFAPAIIVGLVAGALWPWLHPVHAFDGLQGPLAGLADTLLGLAVGLPVGWILGKLCGKNTSGGPVIGLACVGMMLGWQAALVLATVTLLIRLPFHAAGRRTPGPMALMTLATFCWILGWARLAGLVE